MFRLAFFLALALPLGSLAQQPAISPSAAPDYKALYEAANDSAARWKAKADSLQLELSRFKSQQQQRDVDIERRNQVVTQSQDLPPWQEEMAKGYFPYHHLTVADFPINDVAQPDEGMYTWGFFHFRYKAHCDTQNGQVVARATKWLVWSGFDRNKSSRKAEFRFAAEFLPHEQGHLNINELYSRHLAETPLDQLPVGEGADPQAALTDLKGRLQALADLTSEQEAKEQDRYDAETAHGKNAMKQREWTADIQARLDRAGIHL